jgi:hypothetical protein
MNDVKRTWRFKYRTNLIYAEKADPVQRIMNKLFGTSQFDVLFIGDMSYGNALGEMLIK